MTSPQDSHGPDIGVINSELSEGLQACRAMVEDYRATIRKTSGTESYADLDVLALDKLEGDPA